jgi:hypothetical protein
MAAVINTDIPLSPTAIQVSGSLGVLSGSKNEQIVYRLAESEGTFKLVNNQRHPRNES